MIVLGIDPGSIRTGYGAISTDGRRHVLLEHGVIRPPARAPLPARLHFVRCAVEKLILHLHPDVLAVEDLYHAVNARSALVLAHVRGVILETGAAHQIPVEAFPPATVKAQITGFGRAEKSQVALMVQRLLDLPGPGEAGDASDALAVALCQAHRQTSIQ